MPAVFLSNLSYTNIYSIIIIGITSSQTPSALIFKQTVKLISGDNWHKRLDNFVFGNDKLIRFRVTFVLAHFEYQLVQLHKPRISVVEC